MYLLINKYAEICIEPKKYVQSIHPVRLLLGIYPNNITMYN